MTLSCEGARNSNSPATTYTISCTRLRASAERALRKTSIAGGVAVVMRTSSVPVC